MANDAVTSRDVSTGARPGFFRARWQGVVPLSTLLWRDTILVASAINAAATLAALGLLGLGVGLPAVLTVHFSPIPYNIFLFLAVWRTSGRVGGWTAQIAPFAAATWLAVATLI